MNLINSKHKIIIWIIVSQFLEKAALRSSWQFGTLEAGESTFPFHLQKEVLVSGEDFGLRPLSLPKGTSFSPSLKQPVSCKARILSQVCVTPKPKQLSLGCKIHVYRLNETVRDMDLPKDWAQ